MELNEYKKIKNTAKYGAQIILARKDFYTFCRLMVPKFYTKEKTYLKNMCRDLQDFYEDKELQYLIINVPPRHGKSLTLQLFCCWIYSRNKNEKVISISYNRTLSTEFARFVRDTIVAPKIDFDILVYSDIFPNVEIKANDRSAGMWSLKGTSQKSYLASSLKGSLTGFGFSICICDDTLKSALDSYNKKVKDDMWDAFCNTLMSRGEDGSKMIICATRWCLDDITGHTLEFLEDTHKKYKHINYSALQEDGSMLCESVLSYKKYLDLKRNMNEEILEANYNQKIIVNKKDLLYTHFSSFIYIKDVEKIKKLREEGKIKYDLENIAYQIDEDFINNNCRIICYCDTADEGSDYLCAVIGAMCTKGIHRGKVFVLDVLYTQETMEITVPILARKLKDLNVTDCLIEANNGGKNFAREVFLICQNEHKMYNRNFKWAHNNKNKQARMLNESSVVMQDIIFPYNWDVLYTEFFNDMNMMRRDNKYNAHDDCADATTGLAEIKRNLLS